VGSNPDVEIEQSMMGWTVAVNGITMAGPYDRRKRAVQAKKRLRREWSSENDHGGWFR